MSRRAKIILIVAGAVVLLGGGAVVAFWPAITGLVNDLFINRTDRGDTPSDNPLQLTDDEVETRQSRYEDALEAAKSEGAAAGQAVLDTALSSTTDKADRAAIYTQKSTLAGSAEGGADTQTALEYAYKAEEENPSYATAIYIAEFEYYMGDKSKALTYYKYYLERVNEDAIDLNPGDKEAFEKRVQELEATL
jgi:hypothetical protein